MTYSSSIFRAVSDLPATISPDRAKKNTKISIRPSDRVTVVEFSITMEPPKAGNGRIGYRRDKTIPGLIYRLRHKDRFEREIAALGLRMSGAAAIPKLNKALVSENQNVQIYADRVLTEIRADLSRAEEVAATMARIRVLRNRDERWYVRVMAAGNLVEKKPVPDAVVSALVDVLSDYEDDQFVRAGVAEVLARVDPVSDRVVAALAGALKGKDFYVVVWTMLALARLLPMAGATVWRMKKAIGSGDTNALLRAASDLERFGPVVEAAVKDFVEALKDDTWVVRARAASALGDVNCIDEKVVIPLTKALDDIDNWVRLRAARALGKKDQAAWPAIPYLAMRAVFDDSYEVRRESFKAWKKILVRRVGGIVR